jgi:acylphosphatase
MSSKRIQLRVYPDGRIEAEVQGVKGKACTDYIAVLEELLEAETVESAFTPEYYETEEVAARQEQQAPRRVQGGA